MCLQYHSVKEPSKNHDIWVRVLFGSIPGKTRFWIGSVLLGNFEFFPISSRFSVHIHISAE